MKIAVVGAGAIGCFFGGLLARKNIDVTFVGRGRTLERLQKHDLIVKSIRGDFSLPVKVVDAEHLQKEDNYDFILLAVKSTALDNVIPELQTLSGPRTEIVCLLNGIGNEEKLAAIFGDDHVVGGSAFISIIREDPGIVNHVGEGTLAIGEWKKGRDSKSLDSLAEVFRDSGIKTEISANIRQVKWEKLLWNIIYNPLTALTRTRVGEALDDADLVFLLSQVKSEFLSTADAAGVKIGSESVDNVLLPNPEVQNHKTSMLQDLENGRKMELEAILGFVIKTAGEYRIPVKTIETIYHLLRFVERQQEKNRRFAE